MSELHLITVGKLKSRPIEELEQNYLKRLTKFSLKIHELKAYEENLDREASEILRRISNITKEKPNLILLTEHGKIFNSPDFAKFIFKQLETINRSTIFIIGGASGFGNEILEQVHQKLSLSPMTFPHKLARLLFIERLYRAETIRSNHPYHK